MPIPGNLLSVNAEDVETSIADWLSAAGSVTISQDTAHAFSGTHALKHTFSASGTGDTTSTGTIAISANTVYTFSYWCFTATAGRTCISEIDWYVGTTYNSTASLAAVSLVQNQWTLVRQVATSIATADHCLLNIEPVASASAQTFWTDGHFLGRAQGAPPLVISQARNRASTW